MMPIDPFEEIVKAVRAYYASGLKAIRKVLRDKNYKLTDWNKARHKDLEKQLAAIVKQMKSGVDGLIESTVEEVYKDGQRVLPDTVQSGRMYNRIGKERVRLVINQMKTDISKNLAEVARWVNDGLRAAQLQANVMAQTQGLSAAQQEETLENYMNKDNLKVPAGYRGPQSAYTEMVVRTNLAEINRRGRLDKMLSRGVTLFKIMPSFDPCETCKPWENTIISIVPNDEGIPTYEELRQNRSSHIFGPNCRHERLLPVTDRLLAEDEKFMGTMRAKANMDKYRSMDMHKNKNKLDSFFDVESLEAKLDEPPKIDIPIEVEPEKPKPTPTPIDQSDEFVESSENLQERFEADFWKEHKILDEAGLQDKMVPVPLLWARMKEKYTRQQFEEYLGVLRDRSDIMYERRTTLDGLSKEEIADCIQEDIPDTQGGVYHSIFYGIRDLR